MAIPYLNNLDMNKNEIQNVKMQMLATDPQNPEEGLYYYNTNEKKAKIYNGSAWEPFGNVISVNNKTGVVTLTKADIGLGNVDNTSDETKKSNFTGSIAEDDTGFVTGGDVHTALAGKQDTITASGILKGNGSGGVSAATPVTDYGTYSKPNGGIPESDLDSTTQGKIDGALQKSGGTMSGNIAMGGNKITGIGNGTAATDAAAFGQIPVAETNNPAMDGTASPGTSSKWAKGDHVHPTDTSRMAANLKGVAGGVAELDSTGKVPSSQLPSFVDDVIEGYYYNNKFYSDSAHTTEITGESGKIYVDLTTEKTYRWSGSAYAEISASLALGETSSTAYRGDRGKAAYDHSLVTSGNPHNVTKSDVGLGNVDNTSDSTKKSNFTGTIAQNDTGFVTGGDLYTELHSRLRLQKGTVTIGTNATSASYVLEPVPPGGNAKERVVDVHAIQNGKIVFTDVSFNSDTVTFSVSKAPSSAITCVVIYSD